MPTGAGKLEAYKLEAYWLLRRHHAQRIPQETLAEENAITQGEAKVEKILKFEFFVVIIPQILKFCSLIVSDC